MNQNNPTGNENKRDTTPKNTEDNNKDLEKAEQKEYLGFKSENENFTGYENEKQPMNINYNIPINNQQHSNFINPAENFNSPLRIDNTGQIFHLSNFSNEKRSNSNNIK